MKPNRSHKAKVDSSNSNNDNSNTNNNNNSTHSNNAPSYMLDISQYFGSSILNIP